MPTWMPAWMPAPSVYLYAAALAIYLLRFVVWLWAQWHQQRDRIAFEYEADRRRTYTAYQAAAQAYQRQLAV